MDSNNQVLYRPRDFNRVPSIESNIESTISSENGATIPPSHSNISPTLTPGNSNNQSDVSDLGNSPPVLRRSMRIQKPPPILVREEMLCIDVLLKYIKSNLSWHTLLNEYMLKTDIPITA